MGDGRKDERSARLRRPPETQECPVCGYLMGNQKGTVDAVCRNCGFKEACCE